MDRFTVSSDGLAPNVAPLIGNGWMACTVGPDGFHSAETNPTDTQALIAAGHRFPGARHEFIRFGKLSRAIRLNGALPELTHWEQCLRLNEAEVRTRTLHAGLLEETRTLVTLERNLFFVETTLHNQTESDVSIEFRVSLDLTQRFAELNEGFRKVSRLTSDGVVFDFECGDLLGEIRFVAGATASVTNETVATVNHAIVLGPDESRTLRHVVHMSSRLRYEWPIGPPELESALAEHQRAWADFWRKSDMRTGNDAVDDFRRVGLYTLRSQSTPWSIPASLSEPYWGGGAFHDEMYPFLGLLSGGYPELAAKIPYFRLAILPRAVERARARGALYGWSVTETGDERDPHGHWYTERFHLGQFAVCIWFLWLYTNDEKVLRDLYPVLREIARFYELNMLSQKPDGRLMTLPCTDFDESVGEVEGGPFTMGAAAFSLEKASAGACRLQVDVDRAGEWARLARELRSSFVKDAEQDVYTIPNGKHLHSSVIGPIVPFFQDVTSTTAANTRRQMHEQSRSTKGWKPGFSEAFEGSNWMWAAGHLAMTHAAMGDGELAWDAVRGGSLSAGAFHSPNEHLNKRGEVQVPWFTTGVGAWLCGLHWMFARVDDRGSFLLPAVPDSLSDFEFRGLMLAGGVSCACKVQSGNIAKLNFTSPRPQTLEFWVSARYSRNISESASVTKRVVGDAVLVSVELPKGDNWLIREA